MRVTSPKLDTSHLPPNEQAELRCRTTLELKDRSEYDAAREAMFPLWNGIIGSRPTTKGLQETVAADVLLSTGILTGWLGSRSEIKRADDYARDLITESIRLYEALGDSRKVAEARAELGYCYWRSGANDEARIFFNEALKRLTVGGNARANALVGLSVVEWSESHYNEALKLLTDNAPLFERITNLTLKGTYHNQLGITYIEQSRQHLRSTLIIFNAQSVRTAPQMNTLKSPRTWSIALTSRTTSGTCSVTFAV
jgi:tetratricopeptide (TPR) repeat protein